MLLVFVVLVHLLHLFEADKMTNWVHTSTNITLSAQSQSLHDNFLVKLRNGSSLCCNQWPSPSCFVWSIICFLASQLQYLTECARALGAGDHLDCLNEVDLYCLHLVFLPRTNSVLNPKTIILCLVHIILLLTSYLFVGQLNRIWCLNNYKSHLVLMQVDIQQHLTMWGCQETGFNCVLLCWPFCLLLTH